MSEKTRHQQNLARIQSHINELEVRIFELQERIQRQAARGFNTETSCALLAVLVENLEVMEIRRQQEQNALYTGHEIGPTGCQAEF